MCVRDCGPSIVESWHFCWCLTCTCLQRSFYSVLAYYTATDPHGYLGPVKNILGLGQASKSMGKVSVCAFIFSKSLTATSHPSCQVWTDKIAGSKSMGKVSVCPSFSSDSDIRLTPLESEFRYCSLFPIVSCPRCLGALSGSFHTLFHFLLSIKSR